MNERIFELAKRAGKHYRTTVPGADMFPDPVTGFIPEKFLEKFAELIVRECAYLSFSDDNDRKSILKHFGITE